MATAVDTYTFAAEGAALKTYLGITGTAEDTNLTLWLAAAARKCDNLLKGEDFVDDDGNDVAHPAGIRLGVYEWVRAFRTWFQSERQSDLTQRTTGPLRETYRADRVGAQVATEAAAHHWNDEAKDITLWGSVAL